MGQAGAGVEGQGAARDAQVGAGGRVIAGHDGSGGGLEHHAAGAALDGFAEAEHQVGVYGHAGGVVRGEQRKDGGRNRINIGLQCGC